MLQHAIKRFLVLLPAVWLIASAVFLLSKSIPGTASEQFFEQAGQNTNSLAKTEARLQAYRQLLKRTGQDLPLFYFSLAAAAEPDSLHKIFPETDRNALQKLVLKHGNWPAVSSYYLSVINLRQQLIKAGLPLQVSRKLFSDVNNLVRGAGNAGENSIKNIKKAVSCQENRLLIEAINKVEEQRNSVLNAGKPFQTYVPAFIWHGFQNQYHKWISGLLAGNLGYSSRDSRPVNELIQEAFPITLQLAAGTFLTTCFLALLLGLFLSRQASFKMRPVILNSLYALDVFPLFLLALLVLVFFGGNTAGYSEILFTDLALPLFCLVLANLPYLTAQFYAAMQTVLMQDYILVSRAKGLPEFALLRTHALRNALLPVITLLSDFFPALLAGTVVLEVIFSLPGMGRLLTNSVLARDYEVLAGIVALTGSVKILAHLVADTAYGAADPRIRF